MPDGAQTILNIQVGGSAFSTPIADLRQYRALLDCADSIGISACGRERVRVELGGLRRWIAFERDAGGSPLACIGYQETVGARWHDGVAVGGSNRKVLCWLMGDGSVSVNG